MKLSIRAGLLASALILSAVPLAASAAFTPAAAAQADVSFRYFHNQLSRSGDWVYSDRWGEVWLPADVDADWRPYSRGYWVDTDEYGWLWVSNDRQFGDITSHYGRWVYDPYDGWMWVPGYVWSPAWVVWRRSGDYTGWMPMPPDRGFLAGEEFGNVSFGLRIGGLSVSFNNWGRTNDYYGYSRWYGRRYSQNHFNEMWTFVPARHFADRDYRRYEAPRRNIPNFVRTSVNITNYVIVNNYIVNRSVSDKSFKSVDLKGFRRVRAADVVAQPALIVPIDRGRDVQQRMRREMPRGNGSSNSAPKPTEAQVQTLSVPADAKAQERAQKRAARLLTRDAAKVVSRPDGSAPAPLTAADSAKAQDAVNKKKDTGAGPANAVQTPAPVIPPTRKVKDKDQGAEDGSANTAPVKKVRDTSKQTQDNSTSGGASTVTPNTPATDDAKAERKKHRQTDGASGGTAGVTPGAAPSSADNAKAERKKARAKAGQGEPGATPPAAEPAAAPPETTTPNASGAADATQPAADQTTEPKKKKKKHPNAEGDAPADAPQ